MQQEHPNGKRSAASTERNQQAILEVLKRLLPASGRVLEVASGTGEHCALYAPHFPDLEWQPSDVDAGALASTAAWVAESEATNLLPPVELNVTADSWPVDRADAVLCINMIHISPWAATIGLMAGAGRILPAGGLLYLYGAYKIGGRHTAPSNEEFDQWLKSQNERWGVRNMDDVAEEALSRGLRLAETVAMPNNNFSLIFRKE